MTSDAIQGWFVGLATLDVLYQVEALPQPNQKIVALDYQVAAGGPATNAAIAFHHCTIQETNTATTVLFCATGAHPLTSMIQNDLEQWGVQQVDLMPNYSDAPPLSSVLVTRATGERAVVSLNAKRSPITAPLPENWRQQLTQNKVDVVLIDGHQMQLGRQIAAIAQQQQIPIVVDAGSWKPGFESVLPHATYVICSANFHPPNCQTAEEVVAYLKQLGVPHIAITQGDRPILFWTAEQAGEIAVPTVPVVDTLGAGDILHGAFCSAILHHDFPAALQRASTIASRSCQFFGTRQWMQTHS